MEDRFSRNMPTLRPEEQARLAGAHVFVAGCGGLGGHVLELLLRLGVGHITAADGDRFTPSNRNRQLLSLESNLGQSKVSAALSRARDINPDVEFRALETVLDRDNLPELLRGCDLVMDALDSVEARLTLAAACADAGLTLVHGAVEAWLAQVTVLPPGSDVLGRLYGPGTAPAKSSTVLSPAPALCAAVQCAEAAKLLAGRESDLVGRLFVADLEQMEFQIIELA